MTGLQVKKKDHTRDVAELTGAAGDLVQRAYTGLGMVANGKLVQGITTMSPKDMAQGWVRQRPPGAASCGKR